jgi:pyruvate/2-oxoglutarate/acetoin dehydrogenase E1 component
MGVSATVPYWEARARAIAGSLDADPSIVVVGHGTSWPFNPDDGLAGRYPERFVAPPISEFATLGMSVGAACAGLRPCVFVGTSTFMYYGWSAIVNEAPHVRYLSGGEVTCPVVVNIQSGHRRAGGAQHEHTPHAMLQNVAGLTIYMPATPQSIHDVVRTALTAEDPVVIVDHVLLGETEGPLDEGRPVPIAPIETLRDGQDGLVVATSLMSRRSFEAAERLAAGGGPSVGVVNVARISPSPWREVAELAAAHPFTVFVDESRGPGSPASYLLARAAEANGPARLQLLCTDDVPSPFSTELLDEIVPTVDRIEAAIRAAA